MPRLHHRAMYAESSSRNDLKSSAPLLTFGMFRLFTISALAGAIWYFATSHSTTRHELYKRDYVDSIQDDGGYPSPNFMSSVTAAGNTTDLCSNPPRGHCEFYRDCLEAKFHCGPEGYPIGYGEKYCEKFQADQDELSPAGQEWMLNTMQCLQRALVPEAESGAIQTTLASGNEQENECDELKEIAFASHAPCYIDNGLCKLGVADWAHIVGIIGIQTLLGSWDAVKEALETAEGCLDFYAFLFIG